MVVNIVPDRHDQILHVAKDAAAEALVCEVAEESLHHVQPRAAGWREMHLEAGVPIQPPLNLRMFVSRVVVRNEGVFLWLQD